jgi:hypothetical protein
MRWTGTANPILGPGDTMMGASIKYLEWATLQTHLSVALIRYDMGAMNMRATASKFKNTGAIGLGANGYQDYAYSGDYTTNGSLSMILNMNTMFLLSTMFLYFSLLFFTYSGGLFIILVPIGLVLRLVPFMRGFGGALVALGVGLYVMYPMMLAMMGMVVPPLYEGVGVEASKLVKMHVWHGTLYARTFEAQQCGSDTAGIHNCLQDVFGEEQAMTGNSIFDYYDRVPDVMNVDDKLYAYYELTALNFLRTTLLPLAGLLVIGGFVRDLSAIFGEEVDTSKLVQLI